MGTIDKLLNKTKTIDGFSFLKGISQGIIIGIATTAVVLISYYKPQTRDVIGNPNATDPNETYIDTPQGRAFYKIDGQNILHYINKTQN